MDNKNPCYHQDKTKWFNITSAEDTELISKGYIKVVCTNCNTKFKTAKECI